MEVTPETVRAERDWVRNRAPVLARLVNETRERLGELFDTTVDGVGPDQVAREVDAVFADGDRAVNVAAYVGILRSLDVTHDYPGFVVDERLGRALAATIAGGDPLSLLAEATFHYVDAHVHAYARDDRPSEGAGADDLDAALAAGLQTRLPGWDWQASPSPFGVDPLE